MTDAKTPVISPNNVREAFTVEAKGILRDLTKLPDTVMPWSAQRYVYFVRAGEVGPIKIGIAYAPRDRMGDLQITSPDKLTLLATIPGAYCHEKHLHTVFAAERIRGEWFNPAPLLLTLIQCALDRYGGPFERPSRKPARPDPSLADYEAALALSARGRAA